MNENNNKRFHMRMNESLFRKLVAIAEVTGRTKTDVVKNLIDEEYKKNRKYQENFYKNMSITFDKK